MSKTLSLCLLLVALSNPSTAAEVKLENGDVLVGDIVSETEASVVMDHPVLGRIEIPKHALKQPVPPNPGLFGSGFLAGWTRQLSAGASGAAGNSENLNANAQLALELENEHVRRNFLAAYYYASTDGIASSNRFLAELNNDWLLGSSPWFLFGQGRYDYDEFRAWDHRIAGSLGAGYDFMSTDTLTLRGRTGVGYSQTFGDEQESRPEALAGVEAKWHITPQQNIEFSSSFHPDLSDTPEFRTLTSLNWNIALLSMHGLGLKIGAVHEYESDTESMEDFDLRYYGNLSYDF